MRIVAIILLFVPVATYAQIGTIDFSMPTGNTINTGTVPGTVHRIFCPTYFTLDTFGLHTRASAGSVTFGFYFDGIHKASSTVTTTQSWFYQTVGLPCNKGYIDLQIYTSNNSNYYSYQPTYAIANATTSGTYVQNQTSSLYNTFYTKFSLPLTTGSGSTSSVATTTVITGNDQLINFVLLYVIFAITLIGIIFILKPLYVRK